MKDPYISVIITVYNRTQYVNEAINSVLNQSLNKEKYEVIIVSNIDLPEREGVKIIKSNEKMLGPKFTEGIINAKGEVISILEDDDLFLPKKLEVVYNAFKNDEKLGLLKNPIIYRNEYGDEWTSVVPKEPIIVTPEDLNPDKISELISKYEVGFQNSSMSFRKSFIEDHLSYLREIKYAGSDRFIGLLFLFRYKVMIWNDPLSIYRVETTSASHKLSSLDYFIQQTNNYLKIEHEDDMVTYRAIRGTGFENLFERYMNYKKIMMKIWSNKPSEIKINWKEILNARPLDNLGLSRWRVLSYYLISYFPFFLKKKIIFERNYKRELEKNKIYV